MTEHAPDPFVDEQFAGLDLREDPEPLVNQLSEIAEENPEFAPTPEEVEAADPAATPEPAPAAAAPEVPEPDVHEYEDGSTLAVEKTSRGWRATLDSGTGAQPEVFYGKTQGEMWQNVAAGKINATKKIRELNRKVKLAVPAAPTVAEPAAEPAKRELTADDIFELKTKLESNPALAFETWLQKRTGMSVDQLVAMAQQGGQASDELVAEGVSRAFLAANPDYYPLDDNFHLLLGTLAKDKLGRSLTRQNQEAVMSALIRGGHYTVQNLTDAYEELSESGLLETAPPVAEEIPDEPEAPAPARPAAPASAPAAAAEPSGRIVRTVRRPRAGLGIRSSEASAPPPNSGPEKPPSAEELDNLSDDAVNQLFAGVRRAKAQARR